MQRTTDGKSIITGEQSLTTQAFITLKSSSAFHASCCISVFLFMFNDLSTCTLTLISSHAWPYCGSIYWKATAFSATFFSSAVTRLIAQSTLCRRLSSSKLVLQGHREAVKSQLILVSHHGIHRVGRNQEIARWRESPY